MANESFAPVTPATGDDLELFSAAYGTFRWCSCMRWRLRSTPFRDAGKDGRAAALADRVRRAEPVGVLAYVDGEAVGWCSIAPRESYAAVLASRVIPQVPGEQVWSVVCFFVAARARRHGLRARLLEAACTYAAESGAEVVEAYPSPDGRSYRYMGTREFVCRGRLRGRPGPGRLPPRHAQADRSPLGSQAGREPRWPAWPDLVGHRYEAARCRAAR